MTVKSAAGRVERYGLGMEGGKYGQFLISNGGGLFDDTFAPTQCWLANPESIAALDFIAGKMRSIAEKHGPEKMLMLNHGAGSAHFRHLLRAYGSDSHAEPAFAQ